MLHDLETLTGSSVMATDGEMGTVRNFLFDDQSWTIRYLVVDVGNWLTRRAVLIAVTAMENPDWAKKAVHVPLTKEQVRNSPDVDTEKSVSRQQEIAINKYYGWPAHWEDGTFSRVSPVAAGRKFPIQDEEESHLRSAWDVAGYAVCTPGDEVGRLQSFIMNDASWHIGYLDVKAGTWLNSRSVLIPTDWVESISWAHRRVNLAQTLVRSQERSQAVGC